jgi:hypothetical protein
VVVVVVVVGATVVVVLVVGVAVVVLVVVGVTVVVVVVVGHTPRLADDTPGIGGTTNVPVQAHT